MRDKLQPPRLINSPFNLIPGNTGELIAIAQGTGENIDAAAAAQKAANDAAQFLKNAAKVKAAVDTAKNDSGNNNEKNKPKTEPETLKTKEGDLSDKDIKYPDNINHLFEKRDGHLPNTSENQLVIMDLVKDVENYKGPDNWGKLWFSKELPDGTQLWGTVLDDVIVNCGLNKIPKEYNQGTGLSAVLPPKK